MRMYNDLTRDTGTLLAITVRGAPASKALRGADDPGSTGTQTNGTQTNGTQTNGAQTNGTHVNGTHRETPVLVGRRPGSESVAADWVTRRNCADIDPNVFFPNDGAGVIAAQKVCAACPVKDPCREYALANNITHGVWGGTSERQRRRILRDRRREAKAA